MRGRGLALIRGEESTKRVERPREGGRRASVSVKTITGAMDNKQKKKTSSKIKLTEVSCCIDIRYQSNIRQKIISDYIGLYLKSLI